MTRRPEDMITEPSFDEILTKLSEMTEAEKEAWADEIWIGTWGVTRQQFSTLTKEEITAIAEARGITFAAFANGSKFEHTGDGKDHRN